MRIFENAGFAELLHPDIGARCREIAHGIRTGIAVNDVTARIQLAVADVRNYFSSSIFIIGGWEWRLDGWKSEPRPKADLEPQKEHLGRQCEEVIHRWRELGGNDADLWIEIGNEVDLSYWKDHLEAFYRMALVCYEHVRRLSQEVKFITGSTMNFNRGDCSWKKGGYEILDELCEMRWPADTIQGLHPYRGPAREWPSFDSDDHALRALKKVLRGRPVAITEIGWSTHGGYTDQQIAGFLREEIAMWKDFGALCVSPYQIQDGPRPIEDRDSGYGAYSALQDGLEEKPQARAIREAKEMLA